MLVEMPAAGGEVLCKCRWYHITQSRQAAGEAMVPHPHRLLSGY